MQDTKITKVITILLLAIAIGAGVINLCPRATGGTSERLAELFQPAPAWSLKDTTGKTIRSSDLSGKVVIIDFWATWCEPCQVEIPGLIALQKQYGYQGLVVVGASVDEGGVSVVRKFAARLGMNYPVGLANDSMQSAFGGIDVLPTTVFIDRHGRLVKKHVGLTDKTVFETEIKALLQSGAESSNP